ncbi:expressed protein [Phakopsora pachyrhizi]|uniref:Expressed protein n=1 Tax=Phakopsora pachyrhizi TaxID=170000 RepID=A0AAV0BUU2_PHAPC|nr:expressed protein [Phakopsora pachyrhizi]
MLFLGDLFFCEFFSTTIIFILNRNFKYIVSLLVFFFYTCCGIQKPLTLFLRGPILG